MGFTQNPIMFSNFIFNSLAVNDNRPNQKMYPNYWFCFSTNEQLHVAFKSYLDSFINQSKNCQIRFLFYITQSETLSNPIWLRLTLIGFPPNIFCVDDDKWILIITWWRKRYETTCLLQTQMHKASGRLKGIHIVLCIRIITQLWSLRHPKGKFTQYEWINHTFSYISCYKWIMT